MGQIILEYSRIADGKLAGSRGYRESRSNPPQYVYPMLSECGSAWFLESQVSGNPSCHGDHGS